MELALKEFVEKNIKLIEQNRFKELYTIANFDPDLKVYDLTKLLHTIDIDPLQYLDYIPSDFMMGANLNTPQSIDLSHLTHIKSIDNYAFGHNYNIKEIILPPNLETIGSAAVIDSGLEKLLIPKSVKSIGDLAFMDCKSLSEVVIEGAPSIGSNAFAGDHVMRKFIIHDEMLKDQLPPANINTHIEIV